MHKYLIMKYWVLQFFVVISANVLCQKNDANRFYYQDELDYLPHFISYQIGVNKNASEPGLEFNKVLEEILNSCSNIKYSIVSHYGIAFRLSGISPIGASKERYFVLDLDEYGKVVRLDVYNSNDAEQIEECLKEALKMSKINPALKELRPVKCYFVYKFR